MMTDVAQSRVKTGFTLLHEGSSVRPTMPNDLHRFAAIMWMIPTWSNLKDSVSCLEISLGRNLVTYVFIYEEIL